MWMPLLALTALALMPAAYGQVCEQLDLVFIIDSSGSIRATYFGSIEAIEAKLPPTFAALKISNPEYYNKILKQMGADLIDDHWLDMLDFVKSIVRGLDIGPDKVRVGMVTFSHVDHHEFYLNTYTTEAEVLDAIDKATYIGYSTHTRDALEYAEDHLFVEAFGDRPDVPNIAIVVTDGQSNVGGDETNTDTEATIAEARSLQDSGVSVISVGVTDAVNLEELKGMSSPNHVMDTNWFYVEDFNGLVNKVGAVLETSEQQCVATTTVRPVTTTAPPVTCIELTDPDNGEVTTTTLTAGSFAVYTCNDGYELVGTNIRTCSSTGSWDQQPPTCTPITCVELTNPTNGVVTTTTLTAGSTATYICNDGYELTGSSVLTCTSTGTWDKQPPTCTPKACTSCPALPSTLTNGVVTGESTSVGATRTYTCNQNYKINGPTLVTCQADCTWTDTPPVCEPVPTTQPPFTLPPFTLPPQPNTNCKNKCECSVDGDPQVVTFDRELVLITGTGQYTLIKDTLDPNNVCSFDIEINVKDGEVSTTGGVFAMTISRYIVIKILGVRIILNTNKQAMVGNEVVTIPYTSSNGDFMIKPDGSDGVRFQSSKCRHVELKFSSSGLVNVTLCKKHLSDGHTGLCGSCDGDVNDLKTRDGVEIGYVTDADGNRLYRSDTMFQEISDSYKVNALDDNLDWTSVGGGSDTENGGDVGGDTGGGDFGGDDFGGDDFGGDDFGGGDFGGGF